MIKQLHNVHLAMNLILKVTTGTTYHRVVTLLRFYKRLETFSIRQQVVLTELHYQLVQSVLLQSRERQAVEF